MTKLEEFIWLIELNRKLDPFYKDQSWLGFMDWLIEEIQELKDEIQKWTKEELEKEMWDVLWDLFNMFNKLEDEGKINKDVVLSKIISKMNSRKNFLLEWRIVAKDEAMKIWNTAKKSEWCDDSRLWNDDFERFIKRNWK